MSSTTCWPVGTAPSGEMRWGLNGAVDSSPLTKIVDLASFCPPVSVCVHYLLRAAPRWALGMLRL